ncbi:TetR/AcrR family transcriptional regulator [Actinomadura darangshiensis]|uniref:TetR/AcrR family transcriptional regulator n=1 Tax=Actinomadura darangshiensis TaxID=705336 RepID=A0A4R5BNF5_9ACTN|nr:TetR/AcrR family transcriptional regulator [Actinomadura darangshiensis]TDD85492.1 TetR/AcrR family transcriptional regulator [Actinomadura darangshiensis]
MTSTRHNRNGARTADDTVLDAARDCVLAVGVRRTTLTDIARRAGVSRMTLYRRWPDVRTIVADLMTREWTAIGSALQPPDDGRPVRPRMVDGLVTGVRTFRDHPLLRKIIEVDPELLLPYLLDRRGASQRVFLAWFEEAIDAGHRDGTIRPGHPARQARALLLVVQSFGLSAPTMLDAADPGLDSDAFDAELREILERMLAP